MIYVMYEIDHVLIIGMMTCMSMSMTTPIAPAGCHTHRHASRDSYYKNMINLIHHIYHSSHLLAISHHIEHAAKTS